MSSFDRDKHSGFGLAGCADAAFRKQSGYAVETISVGTGQALHWEPRVMRMWFWFTRRAWKTNTSLMTNFWTSVDHVQRATVWEITDGSS
jgi:hypothetical protein